MPHPPSRIKGSLPSSKIERLSLCFPQRPKTLQKLCKECFYHVFETEIHNTITSNNLFLPGEKIAIAASGGKDSTVLAHTMGILNKRYNYGVEFYLLSVDEGITGYRDDSLEVPFPPFSPVDDLADLDLL